MSAPAATAPALSRTNSLGLAFQDVITVILRMKHRLQPVADANAFRTNMRKMISAAVQQVRALGYSDETSQMALYAMIGFLDESVLSLQDPAFAEWAGKPLQAEMFGGFFAGEYFFRHVSDLLNRPDTAEVADALELHAICLLLGYRGRFAFGDAGEIYNIIRLIREKIYRIRGPVSLMRVQTTAEVRQAPRKDPWVRALLIATVVLVLLTVAGFGVYFALLQSGLGSIQTTHIAPPASPVNLSQEKS
jgi:type VI secretion system protein ImpK